MQGDEWGNSHDACLVPPRNGTQNKRQRQSRWWVSPVSSAAIRRPPSGIIPGPAVGAVPDWTRDRVTQLPNRVARWQEVTHSRSPEGGRREGCQERKPRARVSMENPGWNVAPTHGPPPWPPDLSLGRSGPPHRRSAGLLAVNNPRSRRPMDGRPATSSVSVTYFLRSLTFPGAFCLVRTGLAICYLCLRRDPEGNRDSARPAQKCRAPI